MKRYVSVMPIAAGWRVALSRLAVRELDVETAPAEDLYWTQEIVALAVVEKWEEGYPPETPWDSGLESSVEILIDQGGYFADAEEFICILEPGQEEGSILELARSHVRTEINYKKRSLEIKEIATKDAIAGTYRPEHVPSYEEPRYRQEFNDASRSRKVFLAPPA